MAETLDYFVPNVTTQDTRRRLATYDELATYLANPDTSLYCEEMDKFVDGLTSWVHCSNYKISLNGLELLCLLVDRMGDHFKSHVTTVLSPVIDRLGDTKDQVRESAQELLQKLMSPAATPQYIFERMMNGFTHKLWRVREQCCVCLQKTLTKHGSRSLTLSKIVPALIKLLEDQSIPVREASIEALVEIYRHVGERVRTDLCKKDINPSKLHTIMTRMDEVKNSGNMEAGATQDETDFVRPVGIPKGSSKRIGGLSSGTCTGRKPLGSTGKASGSSAGAVDEDYFLKSFEDVAKVHIFSGKEMVEKMGRIREVLSDASHAWEKRVDALKEIRGVMIAGASDYDEFNQQLRLLEPCVILSAKDLRSQVVREACVTLGYLSEQLGNKFEHFAEAVFPTLIFLIPNSAKIMATSGSVCIKFIIQHTHATRLIPIVTSHLTSKSNVIRRECIELLEVLLHLWPTHTLERHIAVLQESIKKGLVDADSEARLHSRKAFWGFAEHFREQADSLLNSLDPAKQKMLQGELSNSSSSNSLSSGGVSRLSSASSSASASAKSKSRSRSMSSERSNQIYSRTLAGPNPPRRTPLSKANAAAACEDNTGGAKRGAKDSGITRSSSAVDLSGGTGTTFNRVGSSIPRGGASNQSNYNSLPRPKKKSVSTSNTAHSILSPERSRPRSKVGVSQSQPGSRSGSPSSRMSYITNINTHNASSRPRKKTGIPRSQGTSRETSPTRTTYGRKSGIPRSQGASRDSSPTRVTYGRERRLSGQSGSKMMGQASRVSKPSGGTLPAQLLPQGLDMEEAVADALSRSGPLRKRYESYDSDDAASETSSICSERSFSSYSKTSEDMAEIVSNLSSGSWADRKEGLVGLQNLLRGNRLLNRLELKKITEIFTRMFHDPHGKVFSVFMETLIELVAAHRAELQDWLYVCLTRLINKMGADLLGSVQVKVQRALDSVRDSFSYEHQFQIVTRFIVDQTQTPNLKVKVALLNYLHGLALLMDPTDFVNTGDTRLAVSRIVTWTTEPKSVDVRKAAQAVLISLFNLNSPEFSMMLSQLPKTFQDGATRILHNHLRSSSQESEPLSPHNVTSPTYGMRFRQPPNRSARIDDMDTENMNPEDIYNSIKKTSADIQNLSKLDSHFDDIKKERDTTSQDSGIQGSMHDIRGNSPDVKDGVSHHHTRGRQYNPAYYQDDSLNGYNKAALAEAVFDVDNDLFNQGFNEDDQPDVVADILKELSNHNKRNEERTSAMLSLIKITREGNRDVWDEHFKTILLLLLETLGDSDGHIRALALRVLREILRHQPARFKEYAELTILKILEAHKDPEKEVSRAAEECATTLAHSLPEEQCIRVLNPIIQTADFPVNLAAIKMETKVVEKAEKDVILRTLSEIIPGLLTGYDNRESPVRKAAVFCLVALYLVIGEDLNPYIKELSGSKMKLLKLYIKRSLAEKGQTDPSMFCSTDTSKTTSPASVVADFCL